MTLQFAILGAGRMGVVHADAIAANKHARVAVVADAVEKAARSLADAHDCRVDNIDNIANDDGIDGVIICSPTNTHADLIETFARAGKAVFCEKPVDLSLARVQKCLAIVEETDALLMIGFNRRFDPHFLGVKNAIASGDIGEVEMVQIISRDPSAPPYEYIKVSGGIFRDMAIHDFDMARFLIGEEISHIHATGSVLTDPEIGKLGDYDSTSITMMTESGKHCTISNSRRTTYGYDQRIEVHGSKGAVWAENQRPVGIGAANGDGIHHTLPHDFFMTRYVQAYAAEIAAFVQTVVEGTTPSPSGRDGLIALAMAEAALRSSKEGRTIALSEIME